MEHLTVTLLLLVIIATSPRILSKYARHPTPPGPKQSWIPLIGNLFDMPTHLPWEYFHQCSRKLRSPLVHLNVAGSSVLVLDTLGAATDLFDQRSSIYSSRPVFTMAMELMAWSFNFIGMPYGDNWRAHRKLFHRRYNSRTATDFQPHQLNSAHDLLSNLLRDPEGFASHISHFTAKIIMSTTYGIDIKPTEDPYVALAEQAFETLNRAAQPGAYLVDVIPALKYIPSWFPGAKFKRDAIKWAKLAIAFANTPFEVVKLSMAKGNSIPSFTSRSLAELEPGPDRQSQEQIIHNVAATTWGATIDTTTAALKAFIMAMVLNPRVVAKAQRQLDSVLHPGEFPTFDHMESLPYICAIVKEFLRWRPPAPLGIPHFLEVEDVYNGFRIPANSVVIGNIWAMLRDEAHYFQPETFNPDRFMKDDSGIDVTVLDPTDVVFGFGRRRCPGRHSAYATLWIATASILHAFDISTVEDEYGVPIMPDSRYDTSGIVSHPIPFQCSIRPRSPEAAQAIIALKKQ